MVLVFLKQKYYKLFFLHFRLLCPLINDTITCTFDIYWFTTHFRIKSINTNTSLIFWVKTFTKDLIPKIYINHLASFNSMGFYLQQNKQQWNVMFIKQRRKNASLICLYFIKCIVKGLIFNKNHKKLHFIAMLVLNIIYSLF